MISDTGGQTNTSVSKKQSRMFGWLGLSVGGVVYAGTQMSLTVTTKFVRPVGLHGLKR
jgi:hypothetical protein